MEEQNLNQYKKQTDRIEPKISVSRDGKWIIIKAEELEQPIIKAVSYFEKIVDSAKKRQASVSAIVEKIKG